MGRWVLTKKYEENKHWENSETKHFFNPSYTAEEESNKENAEEADPNVNADVAENKQNKVEITVFESTDTLDDQNDETVVICASEEARINKYKSIKRARCSKINLQCGILSI